MTITREQLELAAKAAGLIRTSTFPLGEESVTSIYVAGTKVHSYRWSPLTDHGQLLDLAMACSMELDFDGDVVKSWARDYESMWHVHKFPFVHGDFTSLAECVITAAAKQQQSKETKP